jgi:lipoprotein-anchoring transpeptidase ErfK/SrfK
MTHNLRDARPPGYGRGLAAVSVAVLAAGGGGLLAPGPAHAREVVPVSRPLVVLQQGHVAYSRPSRRAHRIEYVAARRPLTGVRTVLPGLGHGNSRSWVRVRLPGRPNGHTGWIRTAHTKRTSTFWRLTLDLSERRVTVYYGGHAKRRFSAVIGAASTPTPTGRYFIEESLDLSDHYTGGPFALATSARSNVLQEFEGGPGQIALHGTQGLAGATGTAASHGCIRLDTSAITWLAHRIGGGIPLTISE